MKNIRTIGLTLILFIGFILPSCDKEDDDGFYCDCSSVQFFDIQGINDFSYYRDSFFADPIMPYDTVSFEKFTSISISYDATFHAFAEPKSDYSFSLMNTANACSCIGGHKGSKTEKIKSFSITTVNDFDDEHLARSNINDLFTVATLIDRNPITLDEYLNSQSGFVQDRIIVLKLQKAPSINPEFNFKIELELSTGEVYEKTGYPVFIES